MKKVSLPVIILIPLLLSGCMQMVLGTAAQMGIAVHQERSLGTAIDDDGILLAIKNAYLQEDVNELTFSISVKVIEGRVYLTGSVKDPATRIKAVRLAWQQQGVKEVIDEIQVVKERSVKQIATDEVITSEISTKLLFDDKVQSMNYTVETVNGVVYMIGIAQNNEELNHVLDIARRVKGVSRVISHVRLKTDPSRM